MFKNYKDLCDVVSLLVYCPSERCYLFTKEASGETWLPSSKCEKNCWKMTANKIHFELFGIDAGTNCHPLRVYKIWLPSHSLNCVYHAVYKVAIKIDVKKRLKYKPGMRNRLQWLNISELERQKAHLNLRSPELIAFVLMINSELKDSDKDWDVESGSLIEICEENVVIGQDVAGGAVAMASPNLQLLQTAGYTREDQIRMYREFVLMVYPAIYMSVNIFSQFMIDLGWQRTQCQNLFRAADVTGRGGLSFLELMLWAAALEPATQHTGMPAEIRCRYIFRYFDSNRDLKLEYVEFKELVAAARAARQLPIDALSVARDADVCLREREKEMSQPSTSNKMKMQTGTAALALQDSGTARASPGRRAPCPDYSVAVYTVRMRRRPPNELLELNNFDGKSQDAVSPSTAHLMVNAVHSFDVLGPSCAPVEALAAVHYFASNVERPHITGLYSSVLPKYLIPVMITHTIEQSRNIFLQRRPSGGSSLNMVKPAWTWTSPAEEATLGSLLLRLAEAVQPICANEPRLLRLSSPVYAVGDLHGNLSALLTMEAALWPSGPALAAARILFLGDYVDRGPHGTELMAYLLAAKLQRPEAVLMVRGNHETRDIQKMFTFYNECLAKYGENEGQKVWNAINNVFDVLPLAAVIDDKVFCCHGGIPPPWVCPLISAIDKVPVPLTRPAEQSSIAWELLWNDPVKPNKITATLQLELTSNEGFAANTKRGTGHVFDQTALDHFLMANQLSHVVRAHEMHQNGFMCQLRGRLVSVFSSFHYCGGTNDSGVALLEGGKLRLMRVNTD
ncbi:unnamed protein product [Spodoptera exigua]|nr:unnamed protein product [Spodoptera exigua]